MKDKLLGDVEEGCLDESAEGKDTNARVHGAEELDDGDGGDEGKLGGIEKTDGHLGSPAV